MKIPGMEGSREEAKRNYKRYIEQYCIASLGRPLEKLSVSCTVCDAIQYVVTHSSRVQPSHKHPLGSKLKYTYTNNFSIKYIRIHQ